MTPFDKFLEMIISSWRLDVKIVAKLAVWLFFLIYIGFSLVVVRQIKLMSRAVIGFLEKELLIMGWGLVTLAVTMFILSLVILWN